MFDSVHHPPHDFQLNINSETIFRAASAELFFQCCFEVLTATLKVHKREKCFSSDFELFTIL
jgi:hypothetical protein